MQQRSPQPGTAFLRRCGKSRTQRSKEASALREKGVETLELDVTDNGSTDLAFKTLYEKTGGILDVLVNNAGLGSRRDFRDLHAGTAA